MTVDDLIFREVMAAFATGVTLVTTRKGDEPYGMTVAAFTSVSLDPPLVLVCISNAAASCEPIAVTRAFAVHVLHEDQVDLAVRFAGGTSMPERFADVKWTAGEATGCPLIPGCLASVECTVEDAHPGGDHTIFVGHVRAATARTGGAALVHHRRAFHGLGGGGG